MRRALLWVACGFTALFTLGHSTGTYRSPRPGAQAAVAETMRSVHFDLFGAERTYLELFHGYGVIIIGVAAFLTVLIWMLSRLDPRQARPLLLAISARQFLFAWVGFADFFWAPGLFNAISALSVLAAALL